MQLNVYVSTDYTFQQIILIGVQIFPAGYLLGRPQAAPLS